MRILSKEEVFMSNVMANAMRKRSRRKNRQKEVIILSYRDLTTAAFRVFFNVLLFLVAIKIATMIWSDPSLVNRVMDQYRGTYSNHISDLQYVWYHTCFDLLKMAVTSLF